jgi:hypothetical protein
MSMLSQNRYHIHSESARIKTWPGNIPAKGADPEVPIDGSVSIWSFGSRPIAVARGLGNERWQQTHAALAAIGEEMMEDSVRRLFERYESSFRRSIDGDVDMDEVASLYASDFIAASPAGVMAGKNDEQLKKVMAQGYAHYRAIGTKTMRIRNVRLSPIDEHHCVAHVAWTATYARQDQVDVAIDFDVHYFVQKLNGEPKVFGWVSGDEQALLRKHGIV